MITLKNELKPELRENMRGGDGVGTVIPLVPETDMNNKGRLFARLILPPGASIGEHPHTGDSETFYFLSGKAEYTENGETFILGPGDVAHLPAEQRHSLRNIGSEPLEVIALILYA